MCVLPHQRSFAHGVASMDLLYHCCQSKIPFPKGTNNRRLLENAITLERKGIFTIATLVVSILRTGLVIYGRDRSTDGTIFYRPVVDRLEIYLIFLWIGRYFQTCWTRQLHACSYFTDAWTPACSYIYFKDGTRTF